MPCSVLSDNIPNDAATGDRDWRDERNSHSESVCGGTNAEYPCAQHGEGCFGVGTDGDSRVREPDSGETSGNTEPGHGDVYRDRDVHDRGSDVLAGAVEPSFAKDGAGKEVTQWRQCTIDTGSGGTEVKTSSIKKV